MEILGYYIDVGLIWGEPKYQLKKLIKNEKNEYFVRYEELNLSPEKYKDLLENGHKGKKVVNVLDVKFEVIEKECSFLEALISVLKNKKSKS